MSKMKQDSRAIKVLHINAGSRQFGGVSAFVFNLFTHMDHTKVSFDMLSPNETTYDIVRDQIENNGGNIYALGVKGSFPVRTVQLYQRLRAFLKEHSYDAVHINSGSVFFNWLVLSAAKSAGNVKVIVHSHNSMDEKDNFLRRQVFSILRRQICRNADLLLACSDKAAEYMFTKDALERNQVKVIFNGIDPERFSFDENVRLESRKNLGMEDCFVVGNIGRLEVSKNQEFLIRVFSRIHEKNPVARLLIYGSGSLKEQLKKTITENRLDEDVRICEPVKEVEKAYMAMDVFVLPSLYEGLPFTAVEAQCIGLPTVLSDAITRETSVCDNVSYLPLDAGENTWADHILKQSGRQEDSREKIREAGYDIRDVAKTMEHIYQELCHE